MIFFLYDDWCCSGKVGSGLKMTHVVLELQWKVMFSLKILPTKNRYTTSLQLYLILSINLIFINCKQMLNTFLY